MVSKFLLATLALSLFTTAAHASGYTNADMATTETQEIGSTTSDGAIWYSMNVCEIVQHTKCDVSLSQGGYAPPEETGDAGDYPPPGEPEPQPVPEPAPAPAPSGGEQPPPSGEPQPAPTESGEEPPPTEGPAPSQGESGGYQPAPTALTTTNEAGEKTTVSGTLVPATTHAADSGAPSGTATSEPSQSSTTAGALALIPAVVPVLACGALSVLMMAI